MIRPYLSDMINDHKTRREIQLKIQINFISSKCSEETDTMDTKSHNIELMMGNKQMKLSKKVLNLFSKIIKKI